MYRCCTSTCPEMIARAPLIDLLFVSKDLDGTVTTLAGVAGQSGSTDGNGAAARLVDPSGITLAPDGNLYIATGDKGARRLNIASPNMVLIVTLPGWSYTSGPN